MENSFSERFIFKLLMFISLAAGLIFFYAYHVDFILAAIEYGKLNIPNIAYFLMRMVGGVFLPIVFIVPSMFEFARIRLAKAGFITYGICHLITLTWIIYFLVANPALDIFSKTAVTDFMTNGGFVYEITYWDSYGLSSSFFAVIYGLFAIHTGMSIVGDRMVARRNVSILLMLKIVLPLIHNIITYGKFFSLYWVANNYLQIASQLFFTIAIFLAGRNDCNWIEFVWDQFVIPETDDAEE